MSKVIVVGGGPAGMFAAIAAAERGHEVVLLEKNEKLGKKIYITGKGRCNLTNGCDTEDLFRHMVSNGKFLYSAIYGFTNFDIVDLVEANGCPVKEERGARMFPVSDHASDVTGALERKMRSLGVKIFLNEPVKDIVIREEKAAGIILEKSGKTVEADAVVIATGGLSYPSTGSTGDGYRFAKEAGHTVTPLSPALVPFVCAEDDVKELQGLSLRNIEVTVWNGKKLLWKEFGEMLFTHFGVSGPLILSASAAIKPGRVEKELAMEIDLKPALTEEQLDARLLREFEEAKNKQFKNAVVHLFPAKMIPVMLEAGAIDPEKKVNEITREERMGFVHLIKAFPLTLCGLRDFNEAIITRGGVSVKEVNPSTMESKLVPGLYFCGELLDLDAMTGGFNLQIAWSTGHLAGESIE